MTYLAQVVLFTDTGLPEDSAVNTFHFEIDPTGSSEDVVGVIENGGDGPAGPLVGPHEALETLYDACGAYYSVLMSGLGETKWYDLDDPKPRAPLVTLPFDYGTTGTTSLPTEVALCVSFQATKFSGINQASRRNRVFLGPLANTAAGTSTSRPDSTATTTIRNAFAAFRTTAEDAPYWGWAGYSEKLGSSWPIADGWIDNAFDTQRRRGLSPSSRVVF